MAPRTAAAVHELLGLLYDGLDRERIDVVLAGVEQELAVVTEDWPSWARSLVDLLEAADGRSLGAGAGVSDPTLAAVARREPLTRDRAQVLAYLDDALYALKQARDLMGRLVRTASAVQLQASLDSARCTGGVGLPRWTEWGAESCRALAVRRGLCRKHYDACLLDEREHNLSTVRQYR